MHSDDEDSLIRIKQAEEVLGDPKKRLLYEVYGTIDYNKKTECILECVVWYLPWFMLAIGLVYDRKGGKWVMIGLSLLAAFEFSRKFKADELTYGTVNLTIAEQSELLRCLFPSVCFYMIYQAGLKRAIRIENKMKQRNDIAKQQALCSSSIQAILGTAQVTKEEFTEIMHSSQTLFQTSLNNLASKDQPQSTGRKGYLQLGLKMGGIFLSYYLMKFIVNSIPETS